MKELFCMRFCKRMSMALKILCAIAVIAAVGSADAVAAKKAGKRKAKTTRVKKSRKRHQAVKEDERVIAYKDEDIGTDDITTEVYVLPVEEVVEVKEAPQSDEEQVFSSAYQMPSFPGGDAALMEFLRTHIRYPQAAADKDVQGKVIVQFVVTKTGRVGEVKVARGVDPDLDREAVRVCKALPAFTPGRNAEGKPVNVWYTLPITFKLSGGTGQDLTGKALEYYKVAINNDAVMQYNLACCYYNGKDGAPKNYNKAVYWFQKSADLGNDNAQGFLGWCYEFGYGVNQNYSFAVYWYQKSADQGNSNAYNNLGRCYYSGNGVEQDYKKAFYWYKKAADSGSAYGQNNLGECYQYGAGTEQDYAEAVYRYKRAAVDGIARAQNNLGDCYFNGMGVEQDYELAAHWYREAAQQGSASAQYKLGRCYANGYGTAQNNDLAIYWLSKAAEYKDFKENAAYQLAGVYALMKDYDNARKWRDKALGIDEEEEDDEVVDDIVVPENIEKVSSMILKRLRGHDDYDVATDVAKAAAEVVDDGNMLVSLAGNIYPDKNYVPLLDEALSLGNDEAAAILSCLYAIGKDVERDDTRAVALYRQYIGSESGNKKSVTIADVYLHIYNEYRNIVCGQYEGERVQWLVKAAELGLVDAEAELGDYYLIQDDDAQQAVTWLTRAAKHGNIGAIKSLAECYNEGKGVDKDRKTAIEWYKKAAEQGDGECQSLVGECYLKGDVLPLDAKKAVKWLRKAVDNGEKKAAYNLGLCYYNGTGVKKDYNQAATLLGEAAGKGLYTNKLTIIDIVEDVDVKESPKTVEAIKEASVPVFDEIQEMALQGDAWAQWELGEQYLGDDNVEEAVLWFSKAAEQDEYYAGELCEFYVKGDAIAQDFDKALYWYRKADKDNESAGLGDMFYSMSQRYGENKYFFLQEAAEYDNANALKTLSCLYAIGYVLRDETQALELYRRYVQLGDSSKQEDVTIANVYYAVYEEYYDLVDYYIDYDDENEEDDTHNIESKETWLEKAAELGLAQAQYDWGTEYFNNEEYDQAVAWYRKAAEQGYGDAQLELGNCYDAGEGVAQDYKQAAQWYQKAADQGNNLAQYWLADCYKEGKGVKKDKKVANEYYYKAATGFKEQAEKELVIK